MSAVQRSWPIGVAVVYVLLVVAGLAVAPAPPGIGTAAGTVVGYYRDQSGHVRMAVWLVAVSLGPLAVVVALVRQRLAGIARDVFLLGAATFTAATTIELWFDAGLATRAATSSPGTLALVSGIGAFFTPSLTVADLLMAVPVAVAAFTTPAFPRWYGYLSVVFAAEQAVETVTIIGREGFTAAGGAMNYTVGAGLFLLWIAASGCACTPVTSPDPRLAAPARH